MRTGRKPGRGAVLLLVGLAALAVGALLVLREIRMPSGDGADPRWSAVERSVARQALATWRLEARGVGGPARRLALADRVTDIERRPGTCSTPVPGAFPDSEPYDYHATVHAYSVFGIEVASARFTCGGLAWEAR
ncbi:MAG TPA: hypothetical protein VF548_10450 [Allosphingosinicella sp.]